MKALVYFIVFLLFGAAAAVVLAPATLVDAQLARVTSGGIRIADAQGTLWRGRGLLTTSDAGWQLPLQWSIAPLALVQRTLRATIGDAQASAYDAIGGVRADRSQVAVDNFAARLPAGVLNAALSPAATIGGEIMLRTARFVATDRTFDGDVAVEWRNARLASPGQPLLSLGTVTATLAGRGDSLSGPVRAGGGDVDADGTLTVRSGRAIIDLRVKPRPDAPAAIRDALSRLGVADATGAVTLRLERPLR